MGGDIMATGTVSAATVVQWEHRFFFISACVMTFVLLAGFSTNILLHRSSFAAPILYHVHAVTFFGWVLLYLLQTGLVATGSTRLHKQLGWVALAWVPVMVILGMAITISVIRAYGGPFFFARDEFLIGNPVGILTFAAIVLWAIRMRRRTDWHSRLMLCAMASITGPGFGRLLPLPLLMPMAWVISAVVFPALFILAGMWRDKRRAGLIHPAYIWSLALIFGTQIIVEVTAFSPVGRAIGDAVTAGTPGAARPLYADWPRHP